MVLALHLNYQGKTILLDDIGTDYKTGSDLHNLVYNTLQLSSTEHTIKLLFKGKRIDNNNDFSIESLLLAATTTTKSIPKILVMASLCTTVQELNSKKSDPTIRGFNQEKKQLHVQSSNLIWGPTAEVSLVSTNPSSTSSTTGTNKTTKTTTKKKNEYKFIRIKECNEHEFGHRCTDTTPHAFAARTILEKLASDPGIVAILNTRQLVVNTLGEMDPIDDRIMQKQQQQHTGSCLLGYNTNHGLRIDIKLRTDDLSTFRPYFELVSTLIHELSHNWISEHDLLFWTNYGQMRVEYFLTHKRIQHILYKGRTSAAIAEIPNSILENDGSNNIVNYIIQQELVREMRQHNLHPQMIEHQIQSSYDELMSKITQQQQQQHTLVASVASGSGSGTSTNSAADGHTTKQRDARTLALEAAEQRRRSNENQQQNQNQNQNKKDDKDRKQ